MHSHTHTRKHELHQNASDVPFLVTYLLGRNTVGEWTSRMEAFGAQLGKIFPSAGNIAARTEQQNMHHTMLIITIKPLLQTTLRLIGSKICFWRGLLWGFLLDTLFPSAFQLWHKNCLTSFQSCTVIVLTQISFNEKNASSLGFFLLFSCSSLSAKLI